MANLPESSTWESGITQIESGETISGGLTGVANRALKQLTNRTKYLYDNMGSGSGGYSYVVKTSNYTAVAGDALIVAAGLTITLPASPSVGDTIYFAVGGDWESSNMTVARNGEKIMGDASDLVADTNQPFSLSYQDSTRGWVLAT